MPTKRIEPMYPDVLGAITKGPRVNMPKLQAALGIFPRRTYINQPIEIVLVLQNMIDQNMQVAIGVQLPTQNKKGEPVIIDVPKRSFNLGLRPGEVGVLHVPIVPQPPTQPGSNYPVRVAIRYQAADEGTFVRLVKGGAPPSVLSVSSVKLHVLQEIDYQLFDWHPATQVIQTYFDIAPRRIPPPTTPLKASFESIWTREEMDQEVNQVMAKVEDAHKLANTLTKTTVYHALTEAASERFAEQGMPLHPGEAKAIAKIMSYTLDEAMELEPGFSLEDSRWFQMLCQLLAHSPDVEGLPASQIAAQHLFDSALYDAVLIGFAVIDPKVKEDLGDLQERMAYANRLMDWFGGAGQPDVSHIYLPLAMGGVVMNRIVSPRDENPWTMLLELREAARGRARLATGEVGVIFKLINQLLDQGEESLRRANIVPPERGG